MSIWTKRAIKAGLSLDFAQALKASEIFYLHGCMATKDAKEGHCRLHREEEAGLERRVGPKKAMLLTPKDEIGARIGLLRPLMEKAALDGAFFHYKIDYYYFSGTTQDGFLFVPIDGPPVLFIKRELNRARRESRLERVVALNSAEEIRPYVRGMKRIGLQLDVMPYNMVITFKQHLRGGRAGQRVVPGEKR